MYFYNKRLNRALVKYPSQNTIAYLDTITGQCLYFHENSNLWAADLTAILESLNY